ncbi:hypothetical protein E2562_011794 [Oryza meyeriana var. granulata]|uniref:Uncharacterized protein n=1 Tax=Oryza meyeriana var. granulata TaxID=110450 RepID=A0A6G1CQ67_9ORYZ|nr:hypothetical protein E2562_011794 [Oryza meyeriana var. granulata]
MLCSLVALSIICARFSPSGQARCCSFVVGAEAVVVGGVIVVRVEAVVVGGDLVVGVEGGVVDGDAVVVDGDLVVGVEVEVVNGDLMVGVEAEVVDREGRRRGREESRPSSGGSNSRGYGRPEESYPEAYFRRGVHHDAEKLTTTNAAAATAEQEKEGEAAPAGVTGDNDAWLGYPEDGSGRGRPLSYARKHGGQQQQQYDYG